MTTRTYAELYDLVQSLCGVQFASIEQARIKNFINRRATRAYRASPYWTRFLVVGEERAVSSSVIPFTESGLSDIDTFIRIHTDKPYVANTVQDYDFHVGGTGATLVCGSLNPTSAWVTYQAAKPDTYGTANGDEQNIPSEWFEYMAHGAYADFLRAEGQQEKAALADQEAGEILVEEMMLPQNIATQGVVATRFRTHLNQSQRVGRGNGGIGESTSIAPDLDGIFESGL